ncbi:MAG: serine/threonine-protein kinase [Burkholderiaceae bacterium]
MRELLGHQADVETDDFHKALPKIDIAAADPSARGPAAGDSVGAYRLIAQIGQGGMGTVWLAERADRLMNRRVALKLPRIVWGEAFAERLAREREILATLAHEHIARLYDAGIDAHGRPFLAMEYVEGEPLDAYLRQHALSIRERIVLLLQVMAAVSHAHARLVVHRDLKPGNILVTPDAKVKLLDFGIAKLLEGDSTLRTALTELSGRALTLDYASPEQIRGEALGTASDVYSMGVVAYEMLAGARPYRLTRATSAELEEAIASVEPPLASESAADPRVARQLRGDLDSILNKALKKAAGDRYPTMDAFAHDLQRHLDGEPVEARPDGLAYRAAKFAQRHRLQVVAAAAVALALIAGTSVALWQAREARIAAASARTEAVTARAVQAFIESVFNANSGNQADPKAARATTARELLDRGADRVDKELAAAPEAQLRLYELMAEMYGAMALGERSLALQRRSLELATRLHGASSEAALSSAANIGQTLDDLGRRDEALAILLQSDAAAAARGAAADRDAVRMRIDTELAQIYFNTDLPKGLERSRRAAAIARERGPSMDGINTLHLLGENARKSGHLEEAQQALGDALAWIDRQPPGTVGALPEVLASLGEVQDRLGQSGAAGQTLGRAVAIAERVSDPYSLHVARYKLARYQYENGLLREATDTARTDYEWARGLGRQHEFGALPGFIMLNYGRALVAFGDAARGLAVIDEARGLLPKETPDRLGPLLTARADALVSLQRLPEAGADIDRAVTLSANAEARFLETVRASRRRYWAASGQGEKALRDFTENAPKAAVPAGTPAALRRQVEEATLQLAAGHTDAARTLATAALAAIDRLPERRFALRDETRATDVLGQSLLREGRAAEALPVLRKSLAIHLEAYDPAHSPEIANARRLLAEAETRTGR